MGEFLSSNIEGLLIFDKKQFVNEAGAVFHFLKNSDEHFHSPAEMYFSFTNPGHVKGWKFHKEMEQNFIVPIGNMKFVFYDDRESSSSRGKIFEIEIGESNYKLLKIPARIWYSFSPSGNAKAMIANATSVVHQVDETLTLDLNDKAIPYIWNK